MRFSKYLRKPANLLERSSIVWWRENVVECRQWFFASLANDAGRFPNLSFEHCFK